MNNDYSALIRESESCLEALEKKLRGHKAQARVQMLRLLKSGRSNDLSSCAALIGYSPRHVLRWWKLYREEGIDSLLLVRTPIGKTSQLTPAALEHIERQIRAGALKNLKDTQSYLQQSMGIEYRSLNGVWWMLKKYGIRFRR